MCIQRRNGFTLIELIVALLVVSALLSLAAPRFVTTLERFRSDEAEHILMAVATAQDRYFRRTGGYASSFADLDVPDPLSTMFAITINDPGVGGGTVATAQRLPSGSPPYTLLVADDGTVTCNNGSLQCTAIGF